MLAAHLSEEEIEQLICGRLGLPESEAVLQAEEHLVGCAECVELLAQSAQVIQALRAACAQSVNLNGSTLDRS